LLAGLIFGMFMCRGGRDERHPRHVTRARASFRTLTKYQAISAWG
jgi:hypothetical protein